MGAPIRRSYALRSLLVTCSTHMDCVRPTVVAALPSNAAKRSPFGTGSPASALANPTSKVAACWSSPRTLDASVLANWCAAALRSESTTWLIRTNPPTLNRMTKSGTATPVGATV